MSNNMNLTLKVWRQKNAKTKGELVSYQADHVSPDMSFLEMLDVVNEGLIKNAIVTGINEEFNQNLENAGRVADFIELGELMVDDALDRKESCGGHFRLESQTPEGEALRDDDNYAYVAAWQYNGDNQPESLHKEELVFENVKLTQRSYK